MTKVYERTENGTTTHLSVEDAKAEIHAASLDRMGDRTNVRQTYRTDHGFRIAYQDDHEVLYTLVNAPKPVTVSPSMQEALNRLAQGKMIHAVAQTVRALLTRGLITDNTEPWDGRGWRNLYMLTDAGRMLTDEPAATPTDDTADTTAATDANAGKQTTEIAPDIRLRDGGTRHGRHYWSIWNAAGNLGNIVERDGSFESTPTRQDFKQDGSKAFTADPTKTFTNLQDAVRHVVPTAYAPTGRSYTVIYTGAGEPIVHATGCAHNLRDSLSGARTSETITGSLTDVAAHVFSDFIDESAGSPDDFIDDLHVKPCAR